jgi:hypothetical protein
MFNHKEKWNTLNVTPPNEIVEVQDADGKIGWAEPTYYPFDVVKKPGDERKPWGFRGTVVYHEDDEMKWDGGWMIYALMDFKFLGPIIHWRKSLIKLKKSNGRE